MVDGWSMNQVQVFCSLQRPPQHKHTRPHDMPALVAQWQRLVQTAAGVRAEGQCTNKTPCCSTYHPAWCIKTPISRR